MNLTWVPKDRFGIPNSVAIESFRGTDLTKRHKYDSIGTLNTRRSMIQFHFISFNIPYRMNTNSTDFNSATWITIKIQIQGFKSQRMFFLKLVFNSYQ